MSRLFRWLAFALALALCPSLAGAEDAPIATGQQTNGKAHVEILSLKRTDGDTVTLRFTMTNGNRNDLNVVLGNMKLIDLAGRRSYGPGITSPSCNIPAGESRTCWTMFGAPPKGAHSLQVSFDEDFGLITVPFTD